jgi:hypothetical protein
VEPVWCIVIPVAAEVGWFVEVVPRLYRNHRAAARLAEGELPLGPLDPAYVVLIGLAWLAYHWPVLPLMLLVANVRTWWVKFGLQLAGMAVTPVVYWLLLSWAAT